MWWLNAYLYSILLLRHFITTFFLDLFKLYIYSHFYKLKKIYNQQPPIQSRRLVLMLTAIFDLKVSIYIIITLLAYRQLIFQKLNYGRQHYTISSVQSLSPVRLFAMVNSNYFLTLYNTCSWIKSQHTQKINKWEISWSLFLCYS